MAGDWTRREVELAVADYIDMLVLELDGINYNKSATRRALIEKLDSRSEGAVERKRMNISAALMEVGIPCIEGYKPYRNYQAIIPDVIDSYLSNHTELRDALDRSMLREVSIPTVEDILKSLENPPESADQDNNVTDSIARRSPVGLDYLQIDASNTLLGTAGEKFTIRFEKARLIYEGKYSLSEQIEHVAETLGPSAGYDVKSYNTNGTDRYIEVKTTKYGKRTPFYISPNEIEFSTKHSKSYQLYRLHNFQKAPKMFTLPGSVGVSCNLYASQYRATVR